MVELGASWAHWARNRRRRGCQQGAGRWTQARVAGVRMGAGVR